MPDAHADLTTERLTAHARFARALARSLLRDEHAAEDVVQDAYVKALTHPPKTNPRSWFATVTRRLSLNARRSASRRVERESAVADDRSPASPADLAAHRESLRRVMDAVLALDEPYRTVVLMRFYEDLQPTEIATRIGVPPATVRTQLRRALTQLRGALDAVHHGDRSAWSVALMPLFAGTTRAPGTLVEATTIAAGGVAMGIGAKIVGSCAALLLGGLAWWTLVDKEPAPVTTTDVAEQPSESDVDTEGSRERDRVRPQPSESTESAGSTAATLRVADQKWPTRSVRVTSEAGTSIANALVLAFNGERVSGSGTTDSDGSVGLEVGNGARAVIVADGRPLEVVSLADEVTEVTLGDGLRVEGLARVDGAAPRHPLRLVLRPDLPVGPLRRHPERRAAGAA